jgi:hypothetical protein
MRQGCQGYMRNLIKRKREKPKLSQNYSIITEKGDFRHKIS